jgi:hypothetical protein
VGSSTPTEQIVGKKGMTRSSNGASILAQFVLEQQFSQYGMNLAIVTPEREVHKRMFDWTWKTG